MRISELPLTTNPTSTDDLPIDRNGVTYRVKYEALRGPKGDPGENGTIENLNAAATTLAPGSQATASYENNLLTLGIPQGAKGNPGTNGRDGVGVPSGGTTGQVLKKKSGTNYDTEWGNATGGTWGSITGTLSNQSDLQTALNAKAAASSVYTKTETDALLNAKADASAIPTKVSDLTNDAGYITPSYLALQDISSLYTFTKTSGNVNVTRISAVRSGNYVMLSIKGDYTDQTTKGSNVLVGTISGGPLPAVDSINLGSYYGDGGSVVFLTTVGAVTVRAIGGNVGGRGTSTTLSIGFLTND
jgi:hypothetical protein